MVVTFLCFLVPALLVVLVATAIARLLARRAAEAAAREAVARVEREARPTEDGRLRIAAAKTPRTTVALRALLLSRTMWPAYLAALAAGG